MTSEGKSFLTQNFIASKVSVRCEWKKPILRNIKMKIFTSFSWMCSCKRTETSRGRPGVTKETWPSIHTGGRGRKKSQDDSWAIAIYWVGPVIRPLLAFVLFCFFSLSRTLTNHGLSFLYWFFWISYLFYCPFSLSSAFFEVSQFCCFLPF